MLNSLPDYNNLDLSGEARSAAERMEARAQEPSSETMFHSLVAPLLTPSTKSALDLGCGTASLARRIAKLRPEIKVLATDKSEGMLQAGQLLAAQEGLKSIEFKPWDVLDEGAFPADGKKFDVILSSVMIIYLDEVQAEDLIKRLFQRLNPGGVLAFIEQDLMTDSLNDAENLYAQILEKEKRRFKRTQSLGLRTTLREQGFEVLARRSYLWTDDRYGPYTRELLERFIDAKKERGEFDGNEAQRFKQSLLDQAGRGDFYYGLTYHCIAGKRAS